MNFELRPDILDPNDTGRFVPRQLDRATGTTESTLHTQTATASHESPSALATSSNSSSNISFSRTNTTLLPPDSSIIDLIPYADVLQNVQLVCRNCTVVGNIELIAGGFSTRNTDAVDSLADFVHEGCLEFQMSDLSAVMDFELTFLPGFTVVHFTAQLPSIPLGTIEIAGLLEFGPVLQLTFPVSVSLNSPVTIRTGFSLLAPPDVTIYLNMSHPESSYTSGLSEMRMDVLPFTADAKNLSMNITTGFKPQLVLGAALHTHVFNASANGGIGVYLDFPQLATSAEFVNDVNEDCDPTTSNPQNDLIRIGSSVTYGGGAEWDISASILDLDWEKDANIPLLSNTTLLSTQCLM